MSVTKKLRWNKSLFIAHLDSLGDYNSDDAFLDVPIYHVSTIKTFDSAAISKVRR